MPEDLKPRFLCLRRKIMEAEFSHMNPRQREAIFSIKGPLLVIAGAGSGKTTVLVNRIACILKYGNAYWSDDCPKITEDDIEYLEGCLKKRCFSEERMRLLLAVDPAPAWSLMAITFTNKAANEMSDRLSAMLGEQSRDIWACTFHSACSRILRRNIGKLDLGYSSSFTIYDSDDSVRVMRDVANGEDRAFITKTALPLISRAKEKCLGPKAFAESCGSDARLRKVSELYEKYQTELRHANALDFDDMIRLTVMLFEKAPDVLDYYRRRFKYVLVDEYQDTNNVQYRLVKMLAGGGNLCVVGDDDQSIYSFRGATIENILGFEKEFGGAKVVKLEQNYRSTPVILEAANSVISNNSGRHEKKLWTDCKSGGKINVCALMDGEKEAEYISEEILASVASGARFSDHAVLYRMNAQSGPIEKAFVHSGIPYRVIGGFRFYERQEIKDIMAYLYVINNKNDDMHFKRIINTPKRGIGNATVETAQRAADTEHIPLYDVFLNCEKYGLAKRASAIEPLMSFFERTRGMAETLPVAEIIKNAAGGSGYLGALEQEDSREADGRIENINTLMTNAIDYEKEQDEPTLSGFLEETALMSDIDNYDADADAVVMMTIHSAKGLEFPCVFLAGVEDGIFPDMSALSYPQELEEERRLAYVGITRAKQTLYMTYAGSRMIFGKTVHNPCSRFIKEIPESCKDFDDRLVHFAPRREAPAVRKKPVISSGGIGILHKEKPAQIFKPGDTVLHGTFGEGRVISARPMGNDMLLEVMFSKYGKKKLMANYAKMKKQ